MEEDAMVPSEEEHSLTFDATTINVDGEGEAPKQLSDNKNQLDGRNGETVDNTNEGVSSMGDEEGNTDSTPASATELGDGQTSNELKDEGNSSVAVGEDFVLKENEQTEIITATKANVRTSDESEDSINPVPSSGVPTITVGSENEKNHVKNKESEGKDEIETEENGHITKQQHDFHDNIHSKSTNEAVKEESIAGNAASALENEGEIGDSDNPQSNGEGGTLEKLNEVGEATVAEEQIDDNPIFNQDSDVNSPVTPEDNARKIEENQSVNDETLNVEENAEIPELLLQNEEQIAETTPSDVPSNDEVGRAGEENPAHDTQPPTVDQSIGKDTLEAKDPVDSQIIDESLAEESPEAKDPLVSPTVDDSTADDNDAKATTDADETLIKEVGVGAEDTDSDEVIHPQGTSLDENNTEATTIADEERDHEQEAVAEGPGSDEAIHHWGSPLEEEDGKATAHMDEARTDEEKVVADVTDPNQEIRSVVDAESTDEIATEDDLVVDESTTQDDKSMVLEKAAEQTLPDQNSPNAADGVVPDNVGNIQSAEKSIAVENEVVDVKKIGESSLDEQINVALHKNVENDVHKDKPNGSVSSTDKKALETEEKKVDADDQEAEEASKIEKRRSADEVKYKEEEVSHLVEVKRIDEERLAGSMEGGKPGDEIKIEEDGATQNKKPSNEARSTREQRRQQRLEAKRKAEEEARLAQEKRLADEKAAEEARLKAEEEERKAAEEARRAGQAAEEARLAEAARIRREKALAEARALLDSDSEEEKEETRRGLAAFLPGLRQIPMFGGGGSVAEYTVDETIIEVIDDSGDENEEREVSSESSDGSESSSDDESGSYLDSSSSYDEDEALRALEEMTVVEQPNPESFKPKKPSDEVIVRRDTAVKDIERANNNIAALNLVFREVNFNEDVANAFHDLIRGENRSWEARAVDILRQKARWDSICFETCSDQNVDACLSILFAMDNCHTVIISTVSLSHYANHALSSLRYCRQLKKLQLDLLALTRAVPYLATGLKSNKTIESICASRCGLDDEMVAQVVEAVDGHPSIKELRLYGNKCRAKGLAAITKLLRNDKSVLEILDLSYQHVAPSEKDFDISWMCAALTTNKTLKVLDLDNCAIDDGNLAHIAAALCENRTVEELMLNHNNITGDGVSLLAAYLPKMKSLKKISMYSNQFSQITS